MKKILSILLSLLILSSCSIVSAAQKSKTVSSECDLSDIDTPLEASSTAVIGQKLDIKAKSVILMEPYTGQILYEADSDIKSSPASITKIMSLLLVMEAIERGDMSVETVITASEHACSMGGSQIWLEPGESMTVDELLKATVIASANDACVALGEHIAGSEEGFVALMNQRAKELGMENTSFVNCTGLDAEGHITTAHDVAIMSCELIKFALIKKYSTIWMDSLRDGSSELVNTNKLVRFYQGTTGLKTGTTSNAGYCLSATAERNGLSLVAVVMSGDTSNDRFNGAKKLLDYGFANYSFSVLDGNLKEKEASVKRGTKKTVKIECIDTVNVLQPKGTKSEISRTIQWNKNISAPLKKGDILGYINVFNGKEQIGKLNIISKESIEKLSVKVTLEWIMQGLFSL